MGEVIKFTGNNRPTVRQPDFATIIILPVICVEHVPVDIEKLRIAARRFARKRSRSVKP